MKKTKLRVLSLFLVMVLFVGLLPASTLAAAVVEPQQTEPQETEPSEVSAEDTQPASMPEESQPQPSNPTEETEVSESTISETTDESSVPADTTEPATESVTEPVEEAATEPVPSAPVPEPEPTDVPTEPVTEPITEASTETAPETPSEAPTEPTEPLLSELKPSEIRLEPQINGPTPEGYVPLSSINTVWMQGYVYRTNESAPNFKYTYTLKDGKHTMDMDHLYIMRLYVDGRYKVAYCIEPDTPVDSGVDYGSGSNSGINGDWKSNLTRDQQKTIGLAMLYSNIHHPDNLSSVESVEWEVATQIIIWEIVIGMRNSTAPYSCTNSSLINQFDNTSKGVRYLDGTDHYLKGIRAKYDIISTDLALHLVIPSFTQKRLSDAPTHTMKQQPNGSFSVSLTDSNGVLSRYKFSSKSPVTINQSGNTLTATAPKGASWGDLSFTASRNIPNPENPACLFRIFYLDGNNQTMASPPDKSNAPYDPVPAYFKLKKEILYGTAALQKTSDSDDVENYCFKLYKHGDRKSWFAKTDRNGQAYVTDKTYNQSGNKTYVFEDLLDGEYTFLEVLSQKGAGYVFPDSWRITVTNGGKTVYDKTFGPKDFVKDANGDCRLNQISITGLTGGGKMTMTIHNRQIPGTASLQKTSDGQDVENFCFKLYKHGDRKSWFAKTDRNGQAYVTDKTYNQSGNKTYVFEGLLDGEYTFLEVLSQKGAGYVFPDSWRITVTNGGKTVYDKTFGPKDFVKDANGDCRLNQISITGLTGGGKMTMTIHNRQIPGTATIAKTSDDYNVENYCFKLYHWDKNKSWFGKTDDRGQVYQTDKSYNQAGTKVYTFEDLLDGEYTFLEVLSQNGAGHVFPDSWEITVKKDGKTTFRQTFGPGDFVKDANGDCRLDKVKITGLTGGGKMTMTINNAPEKAKLDILKQADDGNIAGISFQVEEWIPGIGYWKIGTHTTDVNGRIDLPEVNVDRRYRVTEIVPDGYESEKQAQEITLKPGTNTLTFVNHPLLGSITIRKVDLQSKPLSGITFLLEYSEDDGTTWKPVVFREESSKFMPGGCTSPGLSNGSLTTGTDGTVAFTGLAISTDKRHIQYRLTETATQPGYTLMTEPIFVGELPQDGSRDISFTAVNSGSFSMPHTGSDGFIAVPFGMTLVLLSASALTFTGRKKKKAV